MADPDDTPTMPAILSRAQARAAGMLHYFTGKPCRHGHVAERLVSKSVCLVCARYAKRAYKRKVKCPGYVVTKRTTSKQALALRSDARAAGLTRYFTGDACRRGHVAERFVSNGMCTECGIEQERLSSATDAYRARKKAWRDANPDKAKEIRDRFHAKHPDRVKKSYAKYYEANYEKVRKRRNAYAVRYFAENPEKRTAYWHNRRARKKAAEGSHTGDDVLRIYAAQKGKCACCRKKVGEDYHVDHIVPLARGGSNWPANLQILCPHCNGSKHSRDPVEFMQSRGFLL